MILTKYWKKIKWPAKKEAALLVFAAAIVVFTGWYVVSSTNNANLALDRANSVQSELDFKKENASSSTINSTNNSSSRSGNKTSTPAFKISKVYFAKAPPSNSSYTRAGMACSYHGLDHTFTAEAELTSNASGTAKYHWEEFDSTKYYEDDDNYTALKHPQETIKFNKAETKVVSRSWTYKYPEGQQSYESSKISTQLFLNVMIDSPNVTYANIGTGFRPAYQVGMKPPEFIWGTYVSMCWE